MLLLKHNTSRTKTFLLLLLLSSTHPPPPNPALLACTLYSPPPPPVWTHGTPSAVAASSQQMPHTYVVSIFRRSCRGKGGLQGLQYTYRTSIAIKFSSILSCSIFISDNFARGSNLPRGHGYKQQMKLEMSTTTNRLASYCTVQIF